MSTHGFRDDAWDELVTGLASFAEVSPREPHGLVVSRPRKDASRAVVEIVMTPDEWDDLVSISWGRLDSAVQHVRQFVLDQHKDLRYLVYEQYRLVRSRTSSIPRDPAIQRLLDEAASQPGGIRQGTWSAHRPQRPSGS